MASRIARHLRTHAIAYVAIFLALGAGSFATAKKSKKKVKIPPNSIGAGKIKDNAVKAKKIKDNAVQTTKLLNGAVTREKLDVKIPVAEAVGNVIYTPSGLTVGGGSGINAVSESPLGAGYVCIDTVKPVTTAVGNAANANNFISTVVPSGGNCGAADDILVIVNKDNATQTKDSFSILAF
jgi:hypothetical protein